MIGEPELMEVSPEIQQKLNDLGDFAHKAIRKKRKS